MQFVHPASDPGGFDAGDSVDVGRASLTGGIHGEFPELGCAKEHAVRGGVFGFDGAVEMGLVGACHPCFERAAFVRAGLGLDEYQGPHDGGQCQRQDDGAGLGHA